MINTFDALIYNTDRNSGNLIITPDWKIWMIDHTRAFRRNPNLQRPDSINQCERGLYQKLKGLDEAAVRAQLKEDLSPYELDALFKRRALLVERLDKLIAERGEDKVLYIVHRGSSRPVNPRARQRVARRSLAASASRFFAARAASRSSSSSASRQASTCAAKSVRSSEPTEERPQALSHGSSLSTSAATSSAAVGVSRPVRVRIGRTRSSRDAVGSSSGTRVLRMSRSRASSRNSTA